MVVSLWGFWEFYFFLFLTCVYLKSCMVLCSREAWRCYDVVSFGRSTMFSLFLHLLTATRLFWPDLWPEANQTHHQWAESSSARLQQSADSSTSAWTWTCCAVHTLILPAVLPSHFLFKLSLAKRQTRFEAIPSDTFVSFGARSPSGPFNPGHRRTLKPECLCC